MRAKIRRAPIIDSLQAPMNEPVLSARVPVGRLMSAPSVVPMNYLSFPS